MAWRANSQRTAFGIPDRTFATPSKWGERCLDKDQPALLTGDRRKGGQAVADSAGLSGHTLEIQTLTAGVQESAGSCHNAGVNTNANP